MRTKARDFYHIQDQVKLSWQYNVGSASPGNPVLDSLSLELEELSKDLGPLSGEVARYVDLTHRKISLLEKILLDTSKQTEFEIALAPTEKRVVEVSLSSSGMGFFSETLAEEDASIAINLTLETLGKEVTISGIVLECRSSADSENPGYWLRVRFAKDQDVKIDQLLAHVTQRQIEKLEKKASNK